MGIWRWLLCLLVSCSLLACSASTHAEAHDIPYIFHFKVAAATYGFNWRLLAAQAHQESKYRPTAQSHAGAVGLLQILPRTAEEIARELGITRYDLLSPADSIHMGAYYLAKMRSHTQRWARDYEDNLRLALCAYNAGPHRVAHYRNCPPFKETQDYWRAVFKLWAENRRTHLP